MAANADGIGKTATRYGAASSESERRRQGGGRHDRGMLELYLVLNAVLYAVFSVWCAMAPRTTAAWLGLTPVGPAGSAEYLAVYGGLQAGLAVFYGFAWWQPDSRPTALVLSIAVYGGLVALRSVAAIRFGLTALGNARHAYGLELLLLLAAVLLQVSGGR
jgi:hypothetical protein